MTIFTKRLIIILGAVLGILIIVALVLWLLLRQSSPTTPINDAATTQPTANVDQGSSLPEGGNKTHPLPEDTNVPVLPPLQAGLQQTAFLFTERYGSFSTESNFENLTDVEPLITNSFSTQLRAQRSRDVVADDYYGVVTKALQFTMENLDEERGRATVRIRTQRQETKGISAVPRVYYQDIELALMQYEKTWRVDRAEWISL